MPDVYHLIVAILFTDIVLLVFNILPIYPLDGGQILRSLLWFPLGRARSLLVASFLGFFGVAGLIALALWTQSIWTGLIAAYAGMNCWSGFKTARALRNLEKIPAPPGLCLPQLPNRASPRTCLAVQQVQLRRSTPSRPAASARNVPPALKRPPASIAATRLPSTNGRLATSPASASSTAKSRPADAVRSNVDAVSS